MNGRRAAVWSKLQLIVGNAKQVIGLCADLDTRAYGFLGDLRLDRGPITTYWTNVQKDQNEYFNVSNETWAALILQSLRNGEKVALVTNRGVSYVTFLQEFINEFVPKAKVLVYHSKVDDEIKRNVGNCKKIWPQYDVVIYSPTINTGVDFSVEHFDAVFAYGIGGSSIARSFFQQIRRVRYTKQKRVYFTFHPVFEDATRETLPTDPNEIWKAKKETVKQLAKIAGESLDWTYERATGVFKLTETPYTKLFVRNAVEFNENQNDFQRCFNRILQERKLPAFVEQCLPQPLPKLDEDEYEVFFNAPRIAKALEAEKVANAYCLNDQEAKNVEYKIRTQQATEYHHYQLASYNARKPWGFKSLEPWWVDAWWKSQNYEFNAGSLLRSAAEVADDDKEKVLQTIETVSQPTNLVEHFKPRSVKRDYLLKALEIVGFKEGLMDQQSVHQDEVQKNLDNGGAKWLTDNLVAMSKEFGSRIKGAKPWKPKDAKRVAHTLLIKFCGVSIVTKEEANKKIPNPKYNPKRPQGKGNEPTKQVKIVSYSLNNEERSRLSALITYRQINKPFATLLEMHPALKAFTQRFEKSDTFDSMLTALVRDGSSLLWKKLEQRNARDEKRIKSGKLVVDESPANFPFVFDCSLPSVCVQV